MHQNVFICQSLILSCFEPPQRENKIVYSELIPFCECTSMKLMRARAKLRIETVPSDDGTRSRSSGFLAAIDGRNVTRAFFHVLQSVFCRTQKHHRTSA